MQSLEGVLDLNSVFKPIVSVWTGQSWVKMGRGPVKDPRDPPGGRGNSRITILQEGAVILCDVTGMYFSYLARTVLSFLTQVLQFSTTVHGETYPQETEIMVDIIVLLELDHITHILHCPSSANRWTKYIPLSNSTNQRTISRILGKVLKGAAPKKLPFLGKVWGLEKVFSWVISVEGFVKILGKR